MSRFRYYFLVALLFSQAAVATTEQIDIYIRDDVYEDYLKFVDGRNVLAITKFDSPFLRRDVADMVVLQQALALGGFAKKFNYIPGKVNFRNTKMLENGELLLSFDSYWLTDAKTISDKIYISDPVIKKGQYLAGIFASPDNKKVFAITSVEQLAKLTAVSTPKWKTDWQTLSTLPLKELVQEDEWLSQARMVHMQWVDFMLMPLFNTPDGNYRLEKIHLKMVPKLAVLLNDSRHFVVSRNHPHGKAAFIALNFGLQQLRSTGKIELIYTEAGFLVDHAQYNILNTPKAVD
jgi:hypothetical protein